MENMNDNTVNKDNISNAFFLKNVKINTRKNGQTI
jgi:hypothetical protein